MKKLKFNDYFYYSNFFLNFYDHKIFKITTICDHLYLINDVDQIMFLLFARSYYNYNFWFFCVIDYFNDIFFL